MSAPYPMPEATAAATSASASRHLSQLLPEHRFQRGDPAPVFHSATDNNPRYAFDSVAGRYVLLALLGSTANPASASAWEMLCRARAEGLFDDNRACALVVTVDPADAVPRLADAYPWLRVFRDRDASISRLYHAVLPPSDTDPRQVYAAFALLLDPMLRVIATAPVGRIGDLLDRLRALPESDLHAGV